MLLFCAFVPERRGLADAHAELKTDGKLSAEHQRIAPRSPLGRTTYCRDGVIQHIEI